MFSKRSRTLAMSSRARHGSCREMYRRIAEQAKRDLSNLRGKVFMTEPEERKDPAARRNVQFAAAKAATGKRLRRMLASKNTREKFSAKRLKRAARSWLRATLHRGAQKEKLKADPQAPEHMPQQAGSGSSSSSGPHVDSSL